MNTTDAPYGVMIGKVSVRAEGIIMGIMGKGSGRYLDCGCYIDEDGHRHWCPTCADLDGPRVIQAPEEKRAGESGPEHAFAEEDVGKINEALDKIKADAFAALFDGETVARSRLHKIMAEANKIKVLLRSGELVAVQR